MKVKKSSIFVISIYGIYILSVLIYIFSLIGEYRIGSKKAEIRFNRISRDLTSISKSYTPGTEDFYSEFLKSLGNIGDIAGIQLKYGNELILSYPKTLEELQKINNSLVTNKTTTLNTDKGIQMTVTASIYLLKPSSVFYKSRTAFVIILLATLAVSAYLIFFIKHDFYYPEENEEKEDEYPDVESYEIEDTDEHSEQEEGAQEEEKEDVLAFLNEDSEKTSEEPVEKDASESAEKDNEPKGLFDPETGFGWEEYLITRLDSELIRSASSDQDISLFIIKIPNIDWKSACGKEISKLIIDTVKFKDLVFNFSDDGAAAIFQSKNTDQALVTAEELHTGIISILSSNNLVPRAAIGISSRSLRLISGARLANEAEQALAHARDDEDSPIVAFRVNPDKYRNFLAHSQEKEAVPGKNTEEQVEEEQASESISEEDEEKTDEDDLI